MTVEVVMSRLHSSTIINIYLFLLSRGPLKFMLNRSQSFIDFSESGRKNRGLTRNTFYSSDKRIWHLRLKMEDFWFGRNEINVKFRDDLIFDGYLTVLKKQKEENILLIRHPARNYFCQVDERFRSQSFPLRLALSIFWRSWFYPSVSDLTWKIRLWKNWVPEKLKPVSYSEGQACILVQFFFGFKSRKRSITRRKWNLVVCGF